MQIKVSLNQGFLPDKYTKYLETKQSDQPVISFPIALSDIPKDTKYLAVSLIDYDAVPRTGFPFIHWLAADIPVTDEYITSHYAGPTPSDKPHNYTLTVYALNEATKLVNGFFYNGFRKALQNKIIEQTEIDLTAKN